MSLSKEVPKDDEVPLAEDSEVELAEKSDVEISEESKVEEFDRVGRILINAWVTLSRLDGMLLNVFSCISHTPVADWDNVLTDVQSTGTGSRGRCLVLS